jgi:hypothetical protein
MLLLLLLLMTHKDIKVGHLCLIPTSSSPFRNHSDGDVCSLVSVCRLSERDELHWNEFTYANALRCAVILPACLPFLPGCSTMTVELSVCAHAKEEASHRRRAKGLNI